ncbi:unnamed protein product [Trifolium pratense]|uniref:Uncharacterized protein n=1 Tax=Trifolium pratense TaxID=57577 RepID=A0ACB0L954_TRIPR|nr:unnamed protein product [Trifolium pratense]
MDLNSSPSQLNQSNVDANDNSCHQDESAEFSLKPNQTMDLNSSPSQLNLSSFDANDNSCHQFREKTMDGHEPTDLLVHTAEASAVPELLRKKTTLKRAVVLGLFKEYPMKGKSLGRPKALKIGHEKAKTEFQGTVVIVGGTGDNDGDESQIVRAEKIVEEIPLPTGIEMKKILEFEFPPEDIGNVLQFLEFYRVFGKALDFKKGEAGLILRSLTRMQNMRYVHNTLAIEFQVRLLSLIVSDSDMQPASITASNGKSSWLNVIKNIIAESDCALKDFPLDWLNRGISGYYDLDLSQKLVLLNFICDEALGTKTLRTYIDSQNATFTEEKKAAKSKVADAKGKERNLKLKLLNETAKAVMSTELQDEKGKAVISTEVQDEMAKDIMSTEAQDEMAEAVMSTEVQDEMADTVMTTEASLPNSDHETLLANLKSDADKAHTDLLEAKGAIRKWKKCCDAVRVEPEYMDTSGKAFWKLGCCNDEYSFLLQDVKREDGDSVEADEKWFFFGAEQKDEVNKYIASKRKFGYQS